MRWSAAGTSAAVPSGRVFPSPFTRVSALVGDTARSHVSDDGLRERAGHGDGVDALLEAACVGATCMFDTKGFRNCRNAGNLLILCHLQTQLSSGLQAPTIPSKFELVQS